MLSHVPLPVAPELPQARSCEQSPMAILISRLCSKLAYSYLYTGRIRSLTGPQDKIRKNNGNIKNRDYSYEKLCVNVGPYL